ncbi:MAG: hypothetical protein ACNI25_01910 [Halarcobacter sp.]
MKHRKNKNLNKKNSNFHIMDNPFNGLSEEQRKQVFEDVSKKAEEKYEPTKEKIFAILKEYDFRLILSFLATYNLMASVGRKGISKDKEPFLTQAHIEICQSFILTIPEEEMKFKVPPHSIYKELMDLLKELLESIHYKNMKADFIDLEAEKKSQKMIQEFVKSHTQVVRNWGSFSQVKQITSEIYSKFDEELQKNYNYTCNNLIEFFQYLIGN